MHPSNDDRRLERALSSVGRASALQAECRRFDPVSAHHIQAVKLNDPNCIRNYRCSGSSVG